MEMKIGQKIEVTEGFEIETALGGRKLEVKKGDQGFIDSKGHIHYTTGAARGKIHCTSEFEIKGYDTKNITDIVYNHISNYFDLNEILEDHDIAPKEFKDILEDILNDIF